MLHSEHFEGVKALNTRHHLSRMEMVPCVRKGVGRGKKGLSRLYCRREGRRRGGGTPRREFRWVVVGRE